jgi:phosphoglycolate phosphatase
LIVFDFDGTLCDSKAIGVEIVCQIADEQGLAKLQRITRAEWNSLDARTLIKKASLGPIELLRLAETMRRRIAIRKAELQLFPGVMEGFAHLAETGQILGVLSSNDQVVLDYCLGKLPLHFLQSNRNLFGKAASLKKIATRYNARRKIYVGDEIRDVKAAAKAGYEPLAVAWGGDLGKNLEGAGAHKIFQDVGELFTYLQSC